MFFWFGGFFYFGFFGLECEVLWVGIGLVVVEGKDVLRRLVGL